MPKRGLPYQRGYRDAMRGCPAWEDSPLYIEGFMDGVEAQEYQEATEDGISQAAELMGRCG